MDTSRSDRVSVSARIAAPAARVYAIIADYRAGHPRIVPPRWFGAIEVERGGVGAGTVIRFPMKVLGAQRMLRAEVSEPEPGRVLVESYPDAGTRTSFTVESDGAGAGQGCIVTIATELPRKSGVFARLENFMVRRTLLRIYPEELALLRTEAQREAR